MSDLIFHLLTAFGFAYVVGHSKVSQKAREYLFNLGWPWAKFIELIECPACLGFWYGLIVTQTFTGALVITASNYLLATYTGIMPKEKE